jgi:phosphohistidine phosphatase
MDFYLTRHGEAVNDLVDPSRPLTAAGREAVSHVARLALAKAVQISVIYHSGILRAAQTAEILATHLVPGEGIKVLSGLKPDDDPEIAAAELSAASSPVMLVGHLPHLGRLASLLSHGAGGNDLEFLPAMIASYSREVGRWKLNWTITP